MRIILSLLLALSFSAHAGKPKPQPDGVVWQKDACVSDQLGCLTFGRAVVQLGGSQVRLYANTNDATGSTGDLWMQAGSWATVGGASMVISHADVTDLPADNTGFVGVPFIRTVAVAKGTVSGAYYALLHVGAGYPSNIGFRPAWAISADGLTWQYQHMLTIDGAVAPYVYSSSQALIVQEDKPAVLDTVNPANNRFLAWEDSYYLDGVGKRLVMLYSADGDDWRFWRDGAGVVIDVWPASLAADGPVYPSAARDQYGYHLLVANAYPATAHRHLWSCDGLHWRVLEINADTYVASGNTKGSFLVADPANNLLHALTGVNGSHFQIAAAAYPC